MADDGKNSAAVPISVGRNNNDRNQRKNRRNRRAANMSMTEFQDGRGRSRSMNRRCISNCVLYSQMSLINVLRADEWEFMHPITKKWTLIDNESHKKAEIALSNGAQSIWIPRSDGTQMQLDFKSKTCKSKDRSFDTLMEIHTLIEFVPPLPRVIVKRFLDKNVVVKAAGVIDKFLIIGLYSNLLLKTVSLLQLQNRFRVSERFKRPICQTPRTSDGGINPLFNHIVAFRTSSEDQVLTVSVYSRGTMQDSVVGKFKGLFGESTNDILINRDKSRNSLRRSVSVVPSIQGRTTFEDHLNRMVGCGSYSVKSWFTLSRNLSSTDQYAGELLLDFRFFPNPMSKIIDWNTISRVGLSDHVVRSGKRLFGLSLGQAIKHSE
eukprot:jgi/Bigna1/89979/estExt_fgenesh1_pg.C_590088